MPSDNLESYFQSAIPGVFVNKVTLDIGNELVTSPFDKNPHIIHTDTSDIFEVDNSGGGSETLNVKVDFNLKVKISGNKAKEDLFSSWMFNDYFVSYYRILLLTVTDPNVYMNILNSSTLPADILELINNPGNGATILSLNDLGLFNLTDDEDINNYIKTFHKERDGKTIVYNVPFSHNLDVEQKNPSHLSVFAIPHLDITQIKQDFGISSDMDLMVGQMISERIIHNGKTDYENKVFYEYPTLEQVRNFRPTKQQQAPIGKIWHGPVHSMPGGNWMKGAAHGEYTLDPDDSRGANQINLILKTENTNIVKDFRMIKKLQRKVFDFSFVDTPELGINSPNLSALVNNNLDTVRNPPYFSQLFKSRDQTGQCRLFFSVDYLTLVKKNSVFPIVYEKSTSSEIDALLKSSAIRSFKLIRRRVDKISQSRTINKLGIRKPDNFEENEAPQVLVHTADSRPPGSVVLIRTTNRNEDSDPPRIIASVREINLLTSDVDNRSNYPKMRHFSGVDTEVSRFTNGFYKYGVEIEIEDAAVNYVGDKLSRLVDIIAVYEEYYQVASGIKIRQPVDGSQQLPGGKPQYNFNSVSQRYDLEFVEQLKSNDSESNLYKIGATFSDYVGGHITEYFHILQLLSKDDVLFSAGAPEIEVFVNSLFSTLHPVDGTPEGISEFVKLLYNLANNMEKLLNSVISGPVVKEPANNESSLSSLSRFKINGKRTFKVEKYFSDPEEIFDGNVPKSFGLEYVTSHMLPESSVSDNNLGLITVNTGDYLERVIAETTKFFGEAYVRQDFTLPSGDVLPIARYKSSHLAPSTIHIRDRLEFNVLGAGFNKLPDFYSGDKYSEFLLEALRYNNNLNIERAPFAVVKPETADHGLPFLSLDKQRVRSNLIDLLASKGCTVSSMPSFSSEIENDQNEDYCNIFSDFKKIFEDSKEPKFLDFDPSSDEKTLAQDPTNPNRFLSSLTNYILNYKMILDNYDLYNYNGAILDKLKNAPNQIKALFGAVTIFGILYKGHEEMAGQEVPADWKSDMLLSFKKIQANLHQQSPVGLKTFGFYYTNCMNLAQVEVLSGYFVHDEKDEAQMNKPVFSVLYGSQFTELDDFTATTTRAGITRALCRVKNYEHPDFNIRNVESLNMPIYNEHFFIQRAPAILPVSPSIGPSSVQLTQEQQSIINAITAAPTVDLGVTASPAQANLFPSLSPSPPTSPSGQTLPPTQTPPGAGPPRSTPPVREGIPPRTSPIREGIPPRTSPIRERASRRSSPAQTPMTTPRAIQYSPSPGIQVPFITPRGSGRNY